MSELTSTEKVCILWDYENCPVPSRGSGYDVVHNLRCTANNFGIITQFKAYSELSQPVISERMLRLRSELQTSGVSLTDCPHNGRKDVVDQMIQVDMMAFAMDNPAPATIVLVSGDRDFSYVVAILRQRRYYVVVISPRPPSVTHSLRWQASEFIEWDTIAPPLQPSTPPTLASQPGGVFPEIDPVKPHSSSPQMPPHVTPPQPSSPTAPSEPVSGSFAEATPHKTDWNVFDDEWTSSPVDMPSELLGPSEIERPSIPQMPEVFSSELDDNTPCSPELSSSDIGSEPDESDATTSSTDGTDRASSTETRTADVPVQFQSLVQLLNRLRSKNVHRPYRSIVSLKLYAMDNMVYRVAGVRSFKPFADMARASGVVTLGGENGRAWISLEPRYWSQDTNL